MWGRYSRWLLWLCSAAWLTACGPSGPTSIEFISVTPAQPQIGQDTVVVFQVNDYRGVPLGGQTLNFAALSPFSDGGVSGVTLSPTSSITDKGTGQAQTTVVAQNRVNSVIVVASGGGLSSVSPPITFAGSIPSMRNFTFQCGERAGTASGGVHAIRVYDESRTMTAGIKMNCTAHVGDRNGDGVSGALVSYLTEAGTIEPSQTTTTDAVGAAEILYKSSFPLPEDVAPGTFLWNPLNDSTHTGDYIAPLWMHPYEWVKDPVNDFALQYPGGDMRTEPNRLDPVRPGITNNRRDNLVTMIAITTGEEAYEDTNGNGKWDPGEPFTDITEPFVDSNDNGTWDEGELFVDTNGNGVWDGKNGQYDASTLIWVSEKILWTGVATYEDYFAPQPVVALTGIAQGTVTADNVNVGLVPHCSGIGPYSFVYTDPWYNAMAQDGEGDTCTINIMPSIIAAEPTDFGLSGVIYTYPSVLGATFTIQDGHNCDVNPPPPPFPTPAPWAANIDCISTSSMLGGDTLNFAVFNFTGTVL